MYLRMGPTINFFALMIGIYYKDSIVGTIKPSSRKKVTAINFKRYDTGFQHVYTISASSKNTALKIATFAQLDHDHCISAGASSVIRGERSTYVYD